MRNTRGITLIETVVYIGILAILLPVLTVFLLRVRDTQLRNSLRWHMEDAASLVQSELRQELTTAQSINITNSTLNTDTSILIYTDSAGAQQTIAIVNDVFMIGSENLSANRLQKQSTLDEWLTPDALNVTIWRVEPVRDDVGGVLTGLRITLELDTRATTLNQDALQLSTMIYLPPTVAEL